MVNGKNKNKALDEKGREIPDPNPMEMPLGYRRPPTLQEQIARAVRSEALKAYAEAQGAESFDEADDFEVGDDFDPESPYELEFDPHTGKEMLKAEKAILDKNRKEFDRQIQLSKQEQIARSVKKQKKAEKPVADSEDDEE